MSTPIFLFFLFFIFRSPKAFLRRSSRSSGWIFCVFWRKRKNSGGGGAAKKRKWENGKNYVNPHSKIRKKNTKKPKKSNKNLCFRTCLPEASVILLCCILIVIQGQYVQRLISPNRPMDGWRKRFRPIASRAVVKTMGILCGCRRCCSFRMSP